MGYNVKTLLLSFLFVPALAYGIENPVELLVPLSTDEIPGGYGSRWVTRLWVLNSSDTPLDIGGVLNCVVLPCITKVTVEPHTAFEFTQASRQLPGSPGILILADGTRKHDLSVRLRVQDLSRQSLTWGTEIPTIWESDLLVQEADLLPVPIDPRFRQTLRIYHLGPAATFFVNAYSLQNGGLVGSATLSTTDGLETRYPASAEIGVSALLGNLPEGQVRIEVVPPTDLRYWTFISVTNNETQHVTSITPQMR